jgi:cyclopropane-fatty-acyl-phospholipid synthase
MMATAIRWCERGWIPDWVIRLGIRRLCRATARRLTCTPIDELRRVQQRFIEELQAGPVALDVHKANEQHYEVPAEFFVKTLGARRKYSCCYFTHADTDLDAAEEAMLRLYVERGRFADGQDVLELGCGWGSLTLRLAELFPRSRIVGVSNSAPQRQFIEAECRRRALTNVRIVTADMNDFDPGAEFDRVVSIEMFEHMRNYRELLTRIARWLRPDGKLFVHIFVHKEHAYPFETEGDVNWMGKHFFTGGVMPSDDLLLRFQGPLLLEDHWRVGGEHYERTSNAWLANLHRERAAVLEILTQAHGPALAPTMFHRWRMFFLACAELFGYAGGREWFVAHYSFGKSPRV